MEGWACLPDLVLVQVFSFLGRRERLSAGQVCRRWLQALSAAPLWRQVRVELGGAGSPSEERVAAVLLGPGTPGRYGHLVRSLELRWARPIPRPHGVQPASLAPALLLLDAFRVGGVQLHHLMLHDLVQAHHAHTTFQRGQLLAALAAFLGSQRGLEVLSLQNACLSVSEVLRLLAAAARCSGTTLQDLRLHGAFREWQTPHASPRFSRLLRRLAPLSALSVDYPALSDTTLELLGESCGPSLRRLSVAVRDTDNRQHALSESAWTQLALACPLLKVALNVENMAHYEELRGFLLPGVPLHSFRLYSGQVWDQSRSRDFRATLRLLIAFYSRTLENVQLHLKNSREPLDDLLLELLSRCPLLTSFQYDGVLRHLDTVKDICRLRLHAVINFQTIHVRPRIVNGAVRSASKRITADFQRELAQRTVDFRIEVPTTSSTWYAPKETASGAVACVR